MKTSAVTPFLWIGLFAVPILAAPALLLALAYANPPDPSWIPGIYDDADYDDIVTLVTSATANVAPALPVHAGPTASSVESVTPLIEHVTVASSSFSSSPRAPPRAVTAVIGPVNGESSRTRPIG